jgi:phage minor structural protein
LSNRVRIFSRNETDFTTDGLGDMTDVIVSSVTEWRDNGEWIITQQYKKCDKSDRIESGIITVVQTEKGEQPFRILTVDKENKKYITATGHHECFEINNNFIQDINIEDKTGRQAAEQIKGGLTFPSRFNISSNIDRRASARLVRKNPMDALISNDDNSFINRWGGHLSLDRFNIAINKEIGTDKGVEVAIGKDITYFKGSIDETDIVTGICAESYDGIILPEKIYYSPIYKNYNEPRIVTVKFNDVKYKYSEHATGDEGYETLDEVYEALRKKCDDLFNIENVDKPKCSIRISKADLSKTDEYKLNGIYENVYQGDTVTINLKDYGFNLKLKMISNRYNNLKGSYEDIDFGETQENPFNVINKITDTLDKLSEQLGDNTWQELIEKSKDEAAQLIQSGVKDSYVVLRKNELLIMDSQMVETAANLIRANKNGIAFSQSGYNGPYTIAMTIDGKINADCITTGHLNAALIKAGSIISLDGCTCFDLDTGKITLFDRTNNAYSVEMYDSKIDIYDRFGTSGDKKNMVARLTSRKLLGEDFGYNLGNSANTRTAAGLYSGYGQALEIGFIGSTGKYYPCIVVEGAQAANINQGKRLGIHQDMAILNGKTVNWYGTLHNFIGSISFDADSKMNIWGTGGVNLICGTANILEATKNGVTVYGTFTDSSDLIFKKNVKKLDKDTLQILKDIDIYEYEENGTTEIGLLAQEAKEIIPDIIKGTVTDTTIEEANTMTDEEREEKLKNGGASVDVYSMLSILWDANKKMLNKIESLEAKIEELQSR